MRRGNENAPRQRRALSLSKKVLTSWWTGKQAPPPLPPSPVSAKNQRFFGRGACKETIFPLGIGIYKNRPVSTLCICTTQVDNVDRQSTKNFVDSQTLAAPIYGGQRSSRESAEASGAGHCPVERAAALRLSKNPRRAREGRSPFELSIVPSGVYGGHGAIFAPENPIFQRKNRFLAGSAPEKSLIFSGDW